VRRLLAAFGPEQCIWTSDWPYLRADFRLDYGTLLALADDWFTEDERRQIMWDTPSKIFKG
jgi:predicted TIM-barrel fold metal-dependent hydrolase